MVPRGFRASLVVAGAWLLPAPCAAQSSSASYILQQVSLGSGGRAIASPSYGLTSSAGQETSIGASSSPRYVLQSGFWGFSGSGLAPVDLTIRHNGGTAGNVDLTWTGTNPPYSIYQSADCGNVFASLLATTASNSHLNVTPPAGTLVCYNVLATAPGP